MSTLHRLLPSVAREGYTLTYQEARAVLEEILAPGEGVGAERGAKDHAASRTANPATDPATDQEIAQLLTAMAIRGETAEELAGFAAAMRAAATHLPLTGAERAELVDTCGTGGDGQGTFNISTGAALVAAAAGAKVAKHGNRAVTSKSGSADVLEALGVPVGLAPEEAVACLRATGFMFLLATALHPAMRRVAPIRRALGFRTIFNLAGPLTNPAGAEAQVMGVWEEAKLGVVAEAMRMLGVRHAFVVHGEVGEGRAGPHAGHGLDELTVTGESHVAEVQRQDRPSAAPRAAESAFKGSGAAESAGVAESAGAFKSAGAAESADEDAFGIRRYRLQPEDFGMARASLSALGGGGSAQESAAVLEAILSGREHGARRDVVVLNAAAALVAGGLAADLHEGVARAAAAIDQGKAAKVLAGLRAVAAPSR